MRRPLELRNLGYDNGAYQEIDYNAEPTPPLVSEDAAWADEMLRGKGRRGSGT